MNITVTCISCGKKLSAPETLAGRRVPCPKCNAPVDVPLAASVVQPSAAPVAAVPMAAARPAQAPRPVSDADLLDLGLGAPAAPAQGGPPALPSRAAVRSSGGKKGLPVPLIAAAVLLFLVGGAIGAFFLLSGKGGAGGDLRWLPDDPDVVIAANVSGMINSGAGQKIKSHAEDMLAAFSKGLPKDSKFKPEDVGRMMFGVKVQDKNGAGVVHFNKPITEQDIPPMANGTKKTVGQYQITTERDGAFCLIDPQTLVAGDEATVRKILERNGPAHISDDLTAAMAEVDFSKSLAMAAAIKNLVPAVGGPGRAGPPGGMGGMMSGFTDGIRGGAIQCDVGDDIRVHGVAVCKDSNTATQIKTMVDGFLPLIKMQAAQASGPGGAAAAKGMKILDTLQVSTSGSTVRADLTIDPDLVASMIPAQFGKPMTDSASGAATSTAAPAGFPTNNNPQFNNPQNNAPTAPQAQPLNANPPKTGGNGNAAANGAPLQNPFGARNAAQQMRASNNLKQIALAIHSYASKENHLPPAAISDSSGKPLLSWRVAILPYLGAREEKLFNDFHKDEPWDSTANKRLLARMPLVFRSPRGKVNGFNKTCILAPVGDNFAFGGQKGHTFNDFTDGMSNTILLVEAPADKAVEWTKPDDLKLDESDASASLLGPGETEFLAAFADGAVKSVPQSLGKDAIHALFTINGGETVPSF